MKRIIRIFLLVLLVTIFVTSNMYLYKELNEERKQEIVFEELSNIVEETEIQEENNKINIQKLYEENNDFVGWLKIEDTNINYPIMQTEIERKDYYLKRNFYKEYSSLGTPYIAEYCNILNSDNVIIYGHHITKNKMFGELENYKNKEFYENHKIINFNTIYGEINYEIISVFKTIVYEEDTFKYYDFVKAENKEEYYDFINKCEELSLYETEKTARYGDKLLTLSTCEYSNKNGRLVIVAKMINSNVVGK